MGLNSFGIIGTIRTIRTIKTIRTIRTIKTITRSGITLWFRPLVFLFATILIVLKVSIVFILPLNPNQRARTIVALALDLL